MVADDFNSRSRCCCNDTSCFAIIRRPDWLPSVGHATGRRREGNANALTPLQQNAHGNSCHSRAPLSPSRSHVPLAYFRISFSHFSCHAHEGGGREATAAPSAQVSRGPGLSWAGREYNNRVLSDLLRVNVPDFAVNIPSTRPDFLLPCLELLLAPRAAGKG